MFVCSSWHQPCAAPRGFSLALRILSKVAVLAALRAEPFRFTLRALRQSCSAIGGDGQVCCGGPLRQRPGTAAAEFIWHELFPLPAPPTTRGEERPPPSGLAPSVLPPDDDAVMLLSLASPVPKPKEACRRRTEGGVVAYGPAWLGDSSQLHAPTCWDHYHRELAKARRARSATADLVEMQAVMRLCDQHFHQGDGTKLLRLAATAAGTSTPHGSNWVNATRGSAGLAREAKHLRGHFKTYAAAFHAREGWRQLGHEHKSLKELVDAGRRLTSTQTVAFTILFEAFMKKVQEPWTLQAQILAEPWWLSHRHGIYRNDALNFRRMLFWCRHWLRVVTLLRPFCPLRDLRRLIRASVFAKPSHFFVVSQGQDERIRVSVSLGLSYAA